MREIAIGEGQSLQAATLRRLLLGVEPWHTLGYGERDVDALARTDPGAVVLTAESPDAVLGVAIASGGVLLGGYLRLLVVDPAVRGQGVGRRLMDELEGRVFARWPNLYLCVSDFNLEARGFYEHLGYAAVGRLADLVVPGRSEVLMRKTLGAWRPFLAQTGTGENP
jgi:ribosomal protein S18 acetylase RimI-like enzyme